LVQLVPCSTRRLPTQDLETGTPATRWNSADPFEAGTAKAESRIQFASRSFSVAFQFVDRLRVSFSSNAATDILFCRSLVIRIMASPSARIVSYQYFSQLWLSNSKAK